MVERANILQAIAMMKENSFSARNQKYVPIFMTGQCKRSYTGTLVTTFA
jgi:hypothetical protein